jgi:putative ABC transport system substrate-binding protein
MARDRAVRTRRRFFRGGLALTGLLPSSGCGVLPLPVQPATRVPRIGWLGNASRGEDLTAFRHGLGELGYAEGRSIVIEERYNEARMEPLPQLAAELVRLQVDVIVVAAGNPGIRAARDATSTIPIVMGQSGVDPVAAGLVASLGRPGGNVTGLTALSRGLSQKRLELLKEAAPAISRVAVLWDATVPDKAIEVNEIPEAAVKLGVHIVSLEVREPEEFEGVFAAGVQQQADALLVLNSGLTLTHRARIAELATSNRLASMAEFKETAHAGGLLAYGSSRFETFRRAATYVDKILRGAKPGDLPVEQPTTFDFVINLKTAQALGLTVPPSLMQQATEIIK